MKRLFCIKILSQLGTLIREESLTDSLILLESYNITGKTAIVYLWLIQSAMQTGETRT